MRKRGGQIGLSNGRYAHGHRVGGDFTTTYRTWLGMIQRCTNPARACYKDYGGRGITVCERWRVFENFLADMGERPAGTTLDRFPNNDGNYEQGNCRWATPRQQLANRRPNARPTKIMRDLAGLRFSMLTVVRFSHRTDKRRHHWLCRCECGGESTVDASSLTCGHTKSCGCQARKRAA